MNYTSLSRDELNKSALNAIQDLDFIFKRSTDNLFEKQTNYLLPVVSRPLDHIREVAMALDNQFMQQFNRKGRSNPGTFHPNSSASSHNFGTPPHNMFNPNHNPYMPNMHMPPPYIDVYKPFLFNNITKLRNVITAIDNTFNGGQNSDGGQKLTMIEHAIHVNKLLKNVSRWVTSEAGAKFDPRTLVIQCPADWSKVQIHVTKELQHQAMRHLEAISHPDYNSRLTPTDWEFIEKVANNIDLMKKHEDMLRSTLFYATDKDFIGNNQVSNSHRLYAFHRLINNFVFFNGNDEENFAFINSLVMKD